MFGLFDADRKALEDEYRAVRWNEESGLAPEELAREAESLSARLEAEGAPLPLIKARLFELAVDRAQVAAEPKEFFQNHLRHGSVVKAARTRWIEGVMSGKLADEWAEREKNNRLGVLNASYDFGHTVPDWADVLRLGLPGLLARVREAREAKLALGALTEDQEVFYQSCEIACAAAVRFAKRLAAECRRAAGEVSDAFDQSRLRFCADALAALGERTPRTLHEGLQLSWLTHTLQEEVEGERLRSLGGLDRLYRGLYEADVASGRLTRAQAGELLEYYFNKFHALTGDRAFGEPFYIGGTLPGGESAVNDLTWLILDSYDKLKIVNPKIHVRVANVNPPELTRRVCDCVRRGNSSFVFISDECAIPMMRKVGATEDEAREFVPIGCYEPGIMGREVACTVNGGFSMPKALELALHDGVDPLSGERMGPPTGAPASFDTFEGLTEAVWAQMRALIDRSARLIRAFEGQYTRMNPAPFFSSTMVECLEKGLDAYAGGAKYNNSSLYAYSSGTIADSLAAIYKLVYQGREMTLSRLVEILDGNWAGCEKLRLRMLRDGDKWGNNRDLPDGICVSLSERFARYANSLPNGRGGRFKAAMYTIDYNYYFGERTGATPDGRKAGEPLSRNLGATSTMDRAGVTALILSCAKLDLTEFPSGTVLDIMLHPSTVAGEDGLAAFCALVRGYMDMGGYAIHGNALDADALRDAQAHPEKYGSLQVRVCGWNAYFVNLSRREQDEFIRRAERAQAS